MLENLKHLIIDSAIVVREYIITKYLFNRKWVRSGQVSSGAIVPSVLRQQAIVLCTYIFVGYIWGYSDLTIGTYD